MTRRVFVLASLGLCLSTPALTGVAQVQPWQASPLLSVTEAAQPLDTGTISAVREGMRALQGQMTPQQEAAFDARWSQAEKFPHPALVAYCTKLAPLIEEFLTLKEALLAAAMEEQAAWDEAAILAGFGSEEGTRGSLNQAWLIQQNIQGIAARMQAIADEAAKLGPPPSADALAQGQRKKHADAIESAKAVTPSLTFTVSALKPTLGQAVTFKPVGRGIPAGSQLTWTFGDGGTGKGALAPIVHRYAKAGSFKATVSIAPKGGKPALSPFTKTIQVQKGGGTAGEWTLKKVEVKEEPNSSAYIVKSKTSLQDGAFTCQLKVPASGSYWGGKEITETNLGMGFRWSPFPKALKPGQSFEPDVAMDISMAGDPTSLLATISASNDAFQASLLSSKDLFVGTSKEGKTLTSNVPYQAYSNDLPTLPSDERLMNAPPKFFRVEPGTWSARGSMGKVTLRPGYLKRNALAPTGQAGDTWTLTMMVTLKPRADEYVKGTVVYTYSFGTAGQGTQVETVGPSPAELLKKAKLEELEAGMAYISETIQRLQAARAAEQDPAKQRELDYQIMQAQTSLQAEKDIYESVKTGEYVHTRSPFDDYAQAHFVHSIRENQWRMMEAQRLQAGLLRMADLHPTQSKELKEKILGQMIGQGLAAKGDLEQIRRLAEAVSNQVQGYWEGERAKQDEKVIDAEQNILVAKSVIAASTIVLSGGASELAAAYAAPAWIPTVGIMTYAGTTGYIESGDPVEAIKQSASWSSRIAMLGISAYDGYQAGGVGNVATEMAKGAAIGFLMGKSKSLATAIFGKGPSFKLPPGARPPSGPTYKDFTDSAAYRKEQAAGKTKVVNFEKAQGAYDAAVAKKASPKDIQKAQANLDKAASEVMGDQHAKIYLLKSGAIGPKTKAAYERAYIKAADQVQNKFHELMKAKGFAPQETKLVRNSTSSGVAGADMDLALVEKGPIMRNGRRVSLAEWQREAAGCFSDAVQSVTGKTPKQLWAGITTSGSAEAYKDAGNPSQGVFAGWLSDLRNAQNRAALKREWGQQAGSVTSGKAWEMTNHQGLSRFSGMQEAARGTAKDINTKLLPMLNSAKAPTPQAAERLRQARVQWKEAADVMESFGNGKLGPITARHRLRQLTGRDCFCEAAEDFRAVLEGLMKFN